jgi:hypothetical protein
VHKQREDLYEASKYLKISTLDIDRERGEREREGYFTSATEIEIEEIRD